MGRADGVEKEAREVLHVAGAVGRRADPTANGYPVRVPIHALMRLLAAIFLLLLALPTSAQERGLLLVPDRVFDGEAMQEGWAVLVRADTIAAVGPPGTLGEMRKHYHKEVSDRLSGEIDKDLTGHPLDEIEALIQKA